MAIIARDSYSGPPGDIHLRPLDGGGVPGLEEVGTWLRVPGSTGIIEVPTTDIGHVETDGDFDTHYIAQFIPALPDFYTVRGIFRFRAFTSSSYWGGVLARQHGSTFASGYELIFVP